MTICFQHFKIIKITPREKVLSYNLLLKVSSYLNRTSIGKRMLILYSSCLSSYEIPKNLSNESFYIPSAKSSK